MINRVLIRVKVIQILYSYLITRPDRTFEQATNDLQRSFEKSHELYLQLLKLIPDLAYQEERRLDEAKHKFNANAGDLNPNTRFVDNCMVNIINGNHKLQQLFKDHLITWDDEPLFMHRLLSEVRESEVYKDYMAMEKTDSQSDVEFWRQLMRKVILQSEDLEEMLENQSPFICSEDLDIMGQFVIKSITRMATGDSQFVDPMFKDQEDNEFGLQLFTKTVRDADENNVLIDSCVRSEKWDRSRIALMDRVVMCAAITEIKYFDKIPVTVSLNEYIELAKIFSTPNSGQFVNGILDNVVGVLRKRGKLLKP